ncbi:MAG: hypothetical protein Q7T80_01570 [Methanoregula sp.]|nr:hypothetical protein [Methanoregula sp.]
MGDEPPTPPIITIFGPIWRYVLDYYLITGRLFQLTADQASRFFLYINGILVGQSPPNVTTWSYSPPTNPDPSSTPYIVRVVVQNSNGSTEHIWDWVITPTQVTLKPVLQKINPTAIQLPDIPLNTTEPLGLSISVDQWATVTLKIDGQVYGTPQYVSTPNYEVTFTIGLDYLNNPSHKGEHTIAITAENSNGTSDAALVYNWKLVCPSECLPLVDVINFPFDQFRVYDAESENWSSWMPAACHENAIARFGYGSQEKNQFSSELEQIEWRKNNSTCAYCNISFINPSGPNQKLYLVSSSLNAHAMVAEFLGLDAYFDEDRRIWGNWKFFQYSNQQIIKNIPDPNSNPPFIQIPKGANSSNHNYITIRRVTQIYIKNNSGIRYQGTPVAQFTIDELNDVAWKNEPFQDIPLPD